MKISILCSSDNHPINEWLYRWIETENKNHEVQLFRKREELHGGDILFLISCSEIINKQVRSLFRHVLVIHASDLPMGRGWSPHIWQILDGKTELTVSLLEAEDAVDTGDIWHQIKIHIPKHALYDECNNILFAAEITLMNFAISQDSSFKPRPQDQSIEGTYYRKRTPNDSQLDPQLSISQQFDLMRVCDPERFPAFFELHGHKYIIKMEKVL